MFAFENVPEEGRPEIMEKLGSPEFIRALKEVDIVLGVDEKSGNRFVVYGRSTLRGIQSSGQHMKCRTVKVSIHQDSVELEALIAAVTVAKGYHDYEEASSHS